MNATSESPIGHVKAAALPAPAPVRTPAERLNAALRDMQDAIRDGALDALQTTDTASVGVAAAKDVLDQNYTNETFLDFQHWTAEALPSSRDPKYQHGDYLLINRHQAEFVSMCLRYVLLSHTTGRAPFDLVQASVEMDTSLRLSRMFRGSSIRPVGLRTQPGSALETALSRRPGYRCDNPGDSQSHSLNSSVGCVAAPMVDQRAAAGNGGGPDLTAGTADKGVSPDARY